MSCVQYDDELKSGRMRVTDVAPVARRLGLDGVEYREVYWHDKAAELPAVRDQLGALGLRGTYATFTTLYSPDPEARRQLLEDVADAHALGSSLLRVFRGELPPEGRAGQATRDGARAAVELAGELGLTLALENYARTPGNRLADVLGALERFQTSVMGANVDVSNYVLNDQDPIPAIRALGPRIRYTHLKDVRLAGAEKTPTYLGAGALPYRDILAELDHAGQDFPLCFEFGGEGDPEGVLRASLGYLRSIGYGE
jgi:sugar phosphate isomerase/epimerase